MKNLDLLARTIRAVILIVALELRSIAQSVILVQDSVNI